VVLTIFAKGVPADSVVIDFGEQMVCSAHIIITIVVLSSFTVFTNLVSHFS
jgi:hypothetical protein